VYLDKLMILPGPDKISVTHLLILSSEQIGVERSETIVERSLGQGSTGFVDLGDGISLSEGELVGADTDNIAVLFVQRDESVR
jgi:hypothetical protein